MAEEEGLDVVIQPSRNINAACYEVPTLNHRHVTANVLPILTEAKTIQTAQEDGGVDKCTSKKRKMTRLAIIFAVMASAALVIGLGVVASKNKTLMITSGASFVEGCPEGEVVVNSSITSNQEVPTSDTELYDTSPFNRRLKVTFPFIGNNVQQFSRRLNKRSGCNEFTGRGKDFQSVQGKSNSVGFLICRENIDRPGFGLEEFSSGYMTGTPVYSELTLEEFDSTLSELSDEGTTLSDGLETAETVTGSLAAITTTYPLVSGLFSIASGAIGVANIYAGKNEQSDAEVIISGISELFNSRFYELNQKISKLSDMVADGFSVIRKDLADNELDELMGYLQAIDYAHRNMLNASLTTNIEPGIKKLYVDRYRDACNRPQFTAEDIFRQFYGFACGESGKERKCDVSNGVETGICKYGVKKRQYIQDIYKEGSEGLSKRFLDFGAWLLKAMLLAQFHSSACLPQDVASCIDPFTDPTRKLIAEEQKAAFAEVAANVEQAVECIDNSFIDTLSNPAFYQDETKVPGLKSCLSPSFMSNMTKPSSYLEINECMADKIRDSLQTNFPLKHWAVVVYHDHPSELYFDGDGANKKSGMIHVNANENLGDKVIHLLYRNKDLGPKDLTYVDELSTGIATTRNVFTDDERGYDKVGILVEVERKNDITLGAIESHVGSCYGDPTNPSSADTPNEQSPIEVLRRDQGFIAWTNAARGQPGISSTAFSATKELTQNENLIYKEGSSDPSDLLQFHSIEMYVVRYINAGSDPGECCDAANCIQWPRRTVSMIV